MPRWARLCLIIGVVLAVLGAGGAVAARMLVHRYEGSVHHADLFGDQAAGVPVRHSSITGPLNILLVGIDPRGEVGELPRSDSIMVLHVTESLDRAYLFSIPRDLVVEIPAFPKANFAGMHGKINNAMAFGSRVPGQVQPDPARGFELLSLAVGKYTGIKRFDAGAIIDFNGFHRVVDAMGGVDMYIDTDVKSEHHQPDGSLRPLQPGGGHYMGPQAEYHKGMAHLVGWQALDYVRQRYGLPNGDYDRQRHQQQFIRAMVNQALSRGVVTNPLKLDAVLRAAGQSLTFNGRGSDVAEWALALHSLRSDSIQMVKLPGEGIGRGAGYRGERLLPVAQEFFAAVRADSTGDFLTGHPELVNRER
ncbi:LCP family protein [Plantactinospora siamensis]|uniref:LCP family protein n=1 Tax=Plantactinospora siamensis TaxID=555372 RepID=A0ABV6NYL2_9ACTN